MVEMGRSAAGWPKLWVVSKCLPGGVMVPTKFVISDDRDNVATSVTHIAKGEVVAIGAGDTRGALKVEDDIPLGHKFALRSIAPGREVVKYGEVIGVASAPIAPGEHVHVHNVEGLRGRGDRI